MLKVTATIDYTHTHITHERSRTNYLFRLKHIERKACLLIMSTERYDVHDNVVAVVCVCATYSRYRAICLCHFHRQFFKAYNSTEAKCDCGMHTFNFQTLFKFND